MCRAKIVWMVVFYFIASFPILAQQTTLQNKWTVITPYGLEITCNKTSNLIFPFDIVSVDRGNSTLLVQKAKHVNNILQLKAAAKNADTTNLTVVTADGKFYSFLISYNENPSILNWALTDDSSSARAGLSTSENEAIIQQGSDHVQRAKSFMHKAKRTQGVNLRLQGIYLYQDICYFKLDIKNQSAFNFDPETVRVIVKDKHKTKRSASQEKEMATLLKNPLAVVDGNSSGTLIIPAKAFTIAPTQRLVIQLVEKGNGRTVHVTINAKKLLKIRSIK